jgi:hypothetical protein
MGNRLVYVFEIGIGNIQKVLQPIFMEFTFHSGELLPWQGALSRQKVKMIEEAISQFTLQKRALQKIQRSLLERPE